MVYYGKQASTRRINDNLSGQLSATQHALMKKVGRWLLPVTGPSHNTVLSLCSHERWVSSCITDTVHLTATPSTLVQPLCTLQSRAGHRILTCRCREPTPHTV